MRYNRAFHGRADLCRPANRPYISKYFFSITRRSKTHTVFPRFQGKWLCDTLASVCFRLSGRLFLREEMVKDFVSSRLDNPATMSAILLSYVQTRLLASKDIWRIRHPVSRGALFPLRKDRRTRMTKGQPIRKWEYRLWCRGDIAGNNQ